MNIPIVRRVLEKNDAAAAEIRALLGGRGVSVINLLGGAGCGKTALLEAIIPVLRTQMRVAVLEGDLATTRDAERIARLDVPVVQLLTEGGCHLKAEHVRRALVELPLDSIDLLIIENVGNPICPANFDLGENARIAVLSVAEGDDKPAKHPLLFRRANLVVLTKLDLLPFVRFELEAAIADIRRVNPDADVLLTDTRTRRGIRQAANWIVGGARRRASSRQTRSPAA